MNPIFEHILKSADNDLIIGHRHSEWTGFGPIMEEDIAFASMAQDKIGHALSLYTILHEQFGCADADTQAFKRSEKEFKCCHFVELPNCEFDFSLLRQFLFDHAERVRHDAWMESSFEPLAKFARKVKGEIKYHLLHADTWIVRLGRGTEESHARMQTALNDCFEQALGIFEFDIKDEEYLLEHKICIGESELQKRWMDAIAPVVERAGLVMPAVKNALSAYGGFKGYHTEHLQPLLNEMCEVTNSDPAALSW